MSPQTPRDPNAMLIAGNAINRLAYQGTAMKAIAALLVVVSASPIALVPVLGIWAVDGHHLNSERRMRGRKPQTGWLGASFSQTLTIYYVTLSVLAVLSAF